MPSPPSPHTGQTVCDVCGYTNCNVLRYRQALLAALADQVASPPCGPGCVAVLGVHNACPGPAAGRVANAR